MASPDERRVNSLRELPEAIEPKRDLWPQIEARLKASGAQAPQPEEQARAPARTRLSQLRWLAAAAMVASIAVGVWIGRGLMPGSGTGPAATPVAGNPPPAMTGEGAALDATFVSDPRYQREHAALLKTVQARLAALPAPARAKVAASLATIHKAKEDLESALGRDPSNALLQELLINTYQDEMRALTDVQASASDSGRGI